MDGQFRNNYRDRSCLEAGPCNIDYGGGIPRRGLGSLWFGELLTTPGDCTGCGLIRWRGWSGGYNPGACMGYGMRGRCALIGGDPNGEIFMLLVLVMATYVNTPIITLREAILNCSHLSNPKWSNLGIWVSCEIMHPLFYKAHTSLSIGHTDDSTLFPCAPAFSLSLFLSRSRKATITYLSIAVQIYFHDWISVLSPTFTMYSTLSSYSCKSNGGRCGFSFH